MSRAIVRSVISADRGWSRAVGSIVVDRKSMAVDVGGCWPGRGDAIPNNVVEYRADDGLWGCAFTRHADVCLPLTDRSFHTVVLKLLVGYRTSG